MGIALLDEHVALADSVAGVAARSLPVAGTRAALAELATGARPAGWDRLHAQGLLSLHLPETAGGDGAGLAALAVVVEAAGRSLVPGPFLPTVLAGALLARHGGSTAALTALAGGATGCLALASGGMTAREDDGGWVLSGCSEPVLGALAAEVVVLAARTTDGERWFLLDADRAGRLVRQPVEGVDVTRDVGRLEVAELSVPADAVLDVGADEVRTLAELLFSAEAAGLARWCQETGLAYVGVREQFGRPVGSFQAIKHKCARLFTRTELMAAAVWDAATAADEGADQFALAAACAAETCVADAVDLALDTVTLLGGIGYTWEHDLHLYWRRAIGLAALLGPRVNGSLRLGELALTTARTGALELDDEPAGLRERVAADLARITALPEAERRRALADACLVAPQYPAPYGLGLDPVGQVVVAQEYERAGLEQPSTVIGEWALPTLLAHGTDEQRERYVLPTLRGELVWCQLFSEPGAGSDLASLTTRAVPVDGGWRLDGQKVWTSKAQLADVGICLARTDPEAPKHRGLSYFLVDMRAPGVRIRPLREANGQYMFNEVFLDGVVVGPEALVGAPGEGWRLARTTLGNERVSIATGRSGGGGPGDLAAHARAALDAGTDRWSVLRDLAALTARTSALEALGRRSLLRRLAGGPPGAEASVLKVGSAEHHAQVTRTVLGWRGPEAVETDGPAAAYLSTPQLLIGGGTVEIQLNVVAEHVLGLPRG
ncbi:acyl-CoA dehydrogenase family protein [Blastococcus sp. TF02A-26]|uniref:acyl-CoA dehydrogenase family protein n=1 Tax=Blastococcus sp. TF02A-26 TaxID=2250577 RepID=UPI000DEB5309|nr:acyl-CoA dehydrogenase family protein [Blastococcus sp. TF02A-26]RBY84765.1 acyl-CoA dehydrogenase [Blastococcus sp. TF02A-26]